jgi:replication-associated recombination protein RarA
MKDFLWIEKYAPSKVQDCILPVNVKAMMTDIVTKRNLQNMVFHSSPGTGKTSCATIICEQIGAEYIIINGSDEGRFIDVARNRVGNFASSMNMGNIDVPKVVIYDEFDNTTNDVQDLLRGSINKFQSSCRFIFTGNDFSAITPAIKSRCPSIDFTPVSKTELTSMGGEFFQRMKTILALEKIEVDDKALGVFIIKYMPDFRYIINEVQRYAGLNGKIDMGIMSMANLNYAELFDAVKRLSYKDARTWLASNHIGRNFYADFTKFMIEKIPGNMVGMIIVKMDDYQVTSKQAFDQELHVSACIMSLISIFNNFFPKGT